MLFLKINLSQSTFKWIEFKLILNDSLKTLLSTSNSLYFIIGVSKNSEKLMLRSENIQFTKNNTKLMFFFQTFYIKKCLKYLTHQFRCKSNKDIVKILSVDILKLKLNNQFTFSEVFLLSLSLVSICWLVLSHLPRFSSICFPFHLYVWVASLVFY